MYEAQYEKAAQPGQGAGAARTPFAGVQVDAGDASSAPTHTTKVLQLLEMIMMDLAGSEQQLGVFQDRMNLFNIAPHPTAANSLDKEVRREPVGPLQVIETQLIDIARRMSQHSNHLRDVLGQI